MELKNYIKVFNDFLPYETLGCFLKWVNTQTFEEALVVGSLETKKEIKELNIRNTQQIFLGKYSTSLTNVHWYNYLFANFKTAVNVYKRELNILDLPINFSKFDIGVLKYPINGKYEYHVDHASAVPRSISMLLLCNNDYEGGELCFRNPDGSDEIMIEVNANKCIIWPSNFLYPHCVKPVTKGIKYSVICWAL
jgi:hypothetical protein